MKRPTENDLLALVNALGREKPKRPAGKGWETVQQMAAREGISHGAMSRRFALAIQHGLQVEKFSGSDYDAGGQLRKRTYFRPKQ